jgi:hypothetical protein
MSQSASEQSHGVQQLNGAINEIDHVTQQNVHMVQVFVEATDDFSERAHSLRRSRLRSLIGHDRSPGRSSHSELGRASAWGTSMRPEQASMRRSKVNGMRLPGSGDRQSSVNDATSDE